ncbi:hypothetical protein [Pseudomonas sp. NPDC089569]|uniref:hypothetical protein n=1 Tax=Pseudomonas sp. NPDC089569 TaxID=3390722 RepID=UPI003D06EBFD
MTSIYSQSQETHQQELQQVATGLKLADDEIEVTALETLRYGMMAMRNSESHQECKDISYAMHNIPEALSRRDFEFLRSSTIEGQWAMWKIRSQKAALRSQKVAHPAQ